MALIKLDNHINRQEVITILGYIQKRRANNIIMKGILYSCLFTIYINISLAQTVDLSSVDAFLDVTSTLKEGQEISNAQWTALENSTGYSLFAKKENKFLINTIKTSIDIAFRDSTTLQKDSILNLSSDAIGQDKKLLLKKYILSNYLDIRKNYLSIKAFRDSYNFDVLVQKARQRLSSFLMQPLDSTKTLKPIYFFFMNKDGADYGNAVYIDFNLIYQMTEEQRINFLAHEYFHNYRRYFENNNFNHKNDLNFCIDMIQNEGIADQIDKANGFVNYYNNVLKSPELAEVMKILYSRAQEDLEAFQNAIVQYSQGKISEDEAVDRILDVYKYNGHHIGCYMSDQIIKAGFNVEMISAFYKPFEFYYIYNKAAKKNGTFQLNNEFINYLKEVTQGHYP